MNPLDNGGAFRNLSALVDFSNFINSSLDLKFILNNLLLTCFGKFHTTKGLVALFNDEDILGVKAFKGFPESIQFSIPFVKLSEGSFDDSLLDDFRNKNKLLFCKHIVSYQGVRGIIFLGEKLSKKEYSEEDKEFLNTIVNIASTAIENSIMVETLKAVNRNLDSKVSMLSSLFELGKEFSGILETQRVSKLLIYSIIGQLMVSSYAVVVCSENEIKILDTKIPRQILADALRSCSAVKITSAKSVEDVASEFPDLFSLGIELAVPMQIHGATKGIILLGKRINLMPYTNQDIDYIYSIGSLAMISIENARLFKEALEKQRMEEELQIAREIQKNLLPQFIPRMKSFEMAAYNLAAKQVGGDYYDMVKLDKENCLFAVGDVTGKGVPASLMMANLQAFLKSVCKLNLPIDKATDLINDLVSENTISGNFITFFWGIVNDNTKMLTYVNAGHNPPYLIRNNSITKLTLGGMLLGVMKTPTPYMKEDVELQSGDILVVFTDGITEAMNSNMEEFSDERLENLVLSLVDMSASSILEKIKSEVKDYVAGENQSDDITLLVIKVK